VSRGAASVFAPTHAIAAGLHGQFDLTPRPTMPAVRPRLADEHAASLRTVAGRLEVALRAAEDRQRPAIEASRALRLAAADAIDRASAVGPAALAEPEPMMALRLMRAMTEIDALMRALVDLERTPEPTIEASERTLLAVLVAPEAALRDRCAALVELWMQVRGRPIPIPWPRVGADGGARRTAPYPTPGSAEALIRMAISATRALAKDVDGDAPGDADPHTKPDADWTEALGRAAIDSTSARHAMARRRAISTLGGALETIGALGWIDRNDRARLAALSERALSRLIDDEPARAIAAIHEIAATAELLAAMDRLRTVDSPRFRQTLAVARLLRRIDDPQRLLPAAARDVDDVDDVGQSETLAGKRILTQFVTRMTDTSGEDGRPTGGMTNESLRALRRERRRTEEVLLATLEELAESRDAVTDPRLAAMLAAQRQLHDDLRRLSAISDWTPRLALLDPGREPGVRRQLEKLVRWLRDPNRRPDGDRAAHELERQLTAFTPLPGESLLGENALPSLASGRAAQDALDAVHAARVRWSTEWSVGNGGGPGTWAMWRWHRLLTVAVAVESIRNEAMRDARGRDAQERDAQGRVAWQGGAALAGWPDWIVPDRALRATADAAATFLPAALAGIDRPPDTGLRGRRPTTSDPLRIAERVAALPVLALSLGDALSAQDDAALAQPSVEVSFAALLEPPLEPPAGAFLAAHRTALLQLGIATLEYSAATDDDDARALAEFALSMADDLVDRIAPPRRMPPTLTGFDGSDPDGRR